MKLQYHYPFCILIILRTHYHKVLDDNLPLFYRRLDLSAGHDSHLDPAHKLIGLELVWMTFNLLSPASGILVDGRKRNAVRDAIVFAHRRMRRTYLNM